jgi:hypothetical protein
MAYAQRDRGERKRNGGTTGEVQQEMARR